MTQLILSFCWDGDNPRSTSFVIGNTYEHAGEKYKATEEVYEELLSYKEIAAKPIKLFRSGKIVNVTGVRK